MTIQLILFLLFAILLLTAPFLPMLAEIFRGVDVRASEIPKDQAVDPRRSIDQILWCHAYQLGLGSVEQLREHIRKAPSQAHPSGAFILGSGKAIPDQVSEGQIIGYGPLRVPARRKSGSKILSLTEASVEEGSQLVEIHALGPLTLGARTRILWWASGETVRVGPDAVLTGKISGSREIALVGKSLFHLLESPTIRFGERGARRNVPIYHRVPLQEPIQGMVSWEKSSRRMVCRGEIEIPELTDLDCDLIVQGRLVVGEGALIRGSVKATDGIVLKPGCVVLGSLISQGSIRMESECFARGPIVSESVLELGTGVRIGEPERRTTTIGKRITVLGPCQAHGLVRAWKLGEVRLEGNRLNRKPRKDQRPSDCQRILV